METRSPWSTPTESEVGAAEESALLEAAADLFLVEGYDGASMQQLADSVGLHKSSLYHYVSGKEDLLGKLTSEAQTDAETNMAKAEAKGNKREALIDALTFAIDQTLNDLGKVKVLETTDQSNVKFLKHVQQIQ